jgi:prenyltransferase beta subunit
MPFSLEIIKGIEFLFSTQNLDGGLPSTRPGDTSGIWTTAEALEILLDTPFCHKEWIIQISRMINFLLNHQLSDGCWPIVVDHKNGSTMTTGHVVAALSKAAKLFHSDIANSNLLKKIEKVRSDGLEWLRNSQNADGGWGLEPKDLSAGKESRLIATAYALRGFSAADLFFNNSKHVRAAIEEYFKKNQNQDGSWGFQTGSRGDISSTARALVTISKCGAIKASSSSFRRGLKYLLHQKDFFNTYTEHFIPSSSPGQTVFNANVPYDVLEALLLSNYYGKEVNKLINYFLKNQEDNGSWGIIHEREGKQSLLTWPTAEALIVLDLAQSKYVQHVYELNRGKQAMRWKTLSFVFGILLLIQILVQIGALNIFNKFWNDIPEKVREIISIAVGLAIIVSIIANLATPIVAHWLDSAKNWYKNFSNKGPMD